MCIRDSGRTDPLKDFFDTWKFKILVIVAVFLVGIMAYALSLIHI